MAAVELFIAGPATLSLTFSTDHQVTIQKNSVYADLHIDGLGAECFWCSCYMILSNRTVVYADIMIIFSAFGKT